MEEKRMTFGEHLEELRKRLLYCLITLAVTMGVSLFFQDYLMDFITAPHRKAMAWLHQADAALMAGTYPSVFMNHMKLALITGLVAASPLMAYQIWKFISAGLYPHEKKHVRIFGPVSYTLFLCGCAFAYFVILPYGLYYLAGYGGDPQKFEMKFFLSDYLSLVLMLILVMGLFFELPLVMLFFSSIGLVSPQAYGRWRKFAVISMFVFGAIATPGPDIVSQILVSIPLCLLYEIGILLSRFAYTKKPS